MSATDNRELVQKLLEGGDPGAFVNAMADGVQWTVVGTTVFSGTYKGKDEVLGKLMGPLMGQLQSPGRMVIDNLVAEGDYVVVQARALDRMTTSGKPYNNTYCIVIQLVGGEVLRVDEYCDTELITAAFGN
jgi:ketosteroid isomerase-like protein